MATAPAFSSNWIQDAERYFVKNPASSREIGIPWRVAAYIIALNNAANAESGWLEVPDFDRDLDAAVAAGGGQGAVSLAQRDACRKRFAVAALEVAKHRELQRQRAASVLIAARLVQSVPDDIASGGPAPFEPRENDRSIAHVITAYRAHRAAAVSGGIVDTDRKYNHIFRALEEVIGGDRYIRSMVRDDVRTLLAFLRTVPANASKFYPGKSLSYAAEHAVDDDLAMMSPTTVRTYMANLNAICAFAICEGWLQENPVSGLIPKRAAAVRRRGFTTEEYAKVFGGLANERLSDSSRFWVPAILAYSGARAGEICQLLTTDVKVESGYNFLDLSLFDDNGRRRTEARLKNDHSARAIPLHPELIEAGFLDFVDRRRLSGEPRLFPDLKEGPNGGFSHEISKWFGRYMDRIGLSQPALVLHSTRHKFRESGRAVGLSGEVLDVLGGWASKGAGERYGLRDLVAANAPHMARITFEPFKLSTPPPPPSS